MKKISIILAIVFTIGIMMSGCSDATHLQEIVKNKKIVVGVLNENKPFFVNINGDINGVAVDIIKAIFDNLKSDISFKYYGSKEQIQTDLANKKIDMAISVVDLEDKALKIQKTLPYYDNTQVVVYENEKETYYKLADLSGKKIGLLTSNSAGDMLPLKGLKGVPFCCFDTMWLSFLNKDIYGVLISMDMSMILKTRFRKIKFVNEPLKEEQFYFYVHPYFSTNTDDFTALVNNKLLELKNQKRYKDLLVKWIFPQLSQISSEYKKIHSKYQQGPAQDTDIHENFDGLPRR